MVWTWPPVLIGYARCSTDKQDLEANRQIPLGLGVPADQIYLDRAYSGTSRARPGGHQALADLFLRRYDGEPGTQRTYAYCWWIICGG
jgi:hypothetical protein